MDFEANLKKEIEQRQPEMIAMRRDLHRHPELSFEEKNTAEFIEDYLKKAGLQDVQSNVGGYGVVGLIKGGKPGKTVMVRADTDALPILEQNEVEYRSSGDKAMHACGHDGHVTIALTPASIMAKYQTDLAGNIKFVFQPAEEKGGGANRMIAEGVLQAPEVDAVISLHLWNNLPVGQLGITNGAIFASADGFEITVHGKGGHGALPHQTVDAIVVASHIVVALQTLVSREMTPLAPSVVTVGSFHAGSAFNIISGDAHIAGTFRAITPEAREYLTKRIQEIAEGVARSMRATIGINYNIGVSAVINNPAVAGQVRQAANNVLGDANVLTVEPVTIADDMSEFLKAKPGCYFLMGSANEARGLDFPHHHPRFDFDEACMGNAVEILGRAALDLAH